MKITSIEVGQSSSSFGREDRIVTVRVELSYPKESMRITVVVPENSDERAAREHGLARAKDYARKFAMDPRLVQHLMSIPPPRRARRAH
jgi:hypothetical protein